MLLYLQTLANDRRGATAIEYGLIAALIVLAMVGALQGVAGRTSDLWILIGTKANQNLG